MANGVIVDPGALGAPNVGLTAPNRTVSTPIDTPVTIDVLAGATDSDGGVTEIVDATDGASGSVTATTAAHRHRGRRELHVPAVESHRGWRGVTVSIDVAARGDEVSKYAPLVSTRRDRTAATTLTDAVLSGRVAIFVPTSIQPNAARRETCE